MTARTSAFMNPPIKVVEKLYGNWSCEMSSWDALHKLVVDLQATGSSALAVSRGDEFVANLYSDQQRVAVNVWGSEGETYFGNNWQNNWGQSNIKSLILLCNNWGQSNIKSLILLCNNWGQSNIKSLILLCN